MDLKNAVVLITGSSSGIGAATARARAEATQNDQAINSADIANEVIYVLIQPRRVNVSNVLLRRNIHSRFCN